MKVSLSLVQSKQNKIGINTFRSIPDSEDSIKTTPPGGLEPPTFRLTAERANQLRHGGLISQ